MVVSEIRAPAIYGTSLHGAFAQFPIVCFTLALFTDLIYWRTAHLMWHNFSSWLLFAGLLFGGLALVAALIEALVPSMKPMRPGWTYVLGGFAVLVLAFVNSLVHAGDGWTSIVPYGIILSAITVLVILLLAWMTHPDLPIRERSLSDHV